MSKYSASFLGIALAVSLFLHASVTHAGGSSFSLRTAGKTAFVKPNQTVPSLLQMNMETYFDPTYWPVHSLRLDQVTVECRGDDVMKSASIHLGSKVYGSGSFKRLPQVGKVFQAVIHPKDLALLNDSFYGLQVDAQVKPSSSSFRSAVCVLGEFTFSASMDGKNFVDSLSLNGQTYDINGFSYQETSTASAVVVGDLRRFPVSVTGGSFDLNPSMSGTGYGIVTRTPTGHDQFTLASWDKDAMDSLLSQHHVQTGALFDLMPLTATQRSRADQSLLWKINEVHFYSVPSADGAIGLMSLGAEHLH